MPARTRFTWPTLPPLLVLALLCAASSAAWSQWLGYRTPGVPRTADGGPDLAAPAPRTFDGKPDLSGMWFAAKTVSDSCKREGCITEERMSRLQVNLGLGLPGGLPYTQWAKDQMKVRMADGGRDDPHAHCMPPNYPRAWTLPQYTKIVQTPTLLVMLHEFNAAYRQVYLDGRPLPDDPNPTWNGYSTGHWEGDTLVIDTTGIRDDMWLDIQGSPITSHAHVTERLKRPNFGTMQVELTIDDPQAYTKPFTVAFDMAIEVDSQMLDEICLDDEQDAQLYK